jgi:hypothetical protein
MSGLASLLALSSATGRRSGEPPGASLREAREALAYWRQREASLPWHRRAARAEAREMAARWRGRLMSAHLERWGGGNAQLLNPVVAFLALPRRRRTRLIASTVLRSRSARRLRRLAIGLGLLSLAAFALLTILVAQLL